MKIYLNLIKESWVVDRFKSEFILFNKNIITKRIRFSDVVWIIAPWTWKIKDFSKTKNKKNKNPENKCKIQFDFEDSNKNESISSCCIASKLSDESEVRSAIRC